MDFVYLISQTFVIIAIVFLGMSYLVKDKKTIMILCIVYCMFYGTHYLLLGAMTGATMTAICAIRNICFFINVKRNVENSKFTLIIFFAALIVFGAMTYQDIFSVVSIVSCLLSTYSVWQKDTKVYRTLAVPVSFCYIAYAIHINSIFSLITEVMLLIVEIIGIVRYKKIEAK